jgi:hypothetical protein
MIVRVMDYDWGKKDDLLGETVVDVASLVRSGQQQSFSLTIKGAPVKGKSGSVSSVVLSAVTFNESGEWLCRLRVHSASDLKKADWFGKNDVYVQAYPCPPGTNEHHKLPEPEKRCIVTAGNHSYPFQFPLRADGPSSTELGEGDSSYIRYSLYANVDLALWKVPHTLKP